MRRTLLSVVAAVIVSAVLVGCGSDHDGHMGDGDMGEMEGMGGHSEASPVAEGARKVRVKASSFRFQPDQLRAEVGEDLAVVLASDDALHDFTIDELDAHVSAKAGETVTGGLRAEKAGRYTYYCSVPGHRTAGMEGTLVVRWS